MAPKLQGLIFTVKIMYFQFFSFHNNMFLPSSYQNTNFQEKRGFVINSILVKMHKIRYNLNLIHQVAKFGKMQQNIQSKVQRENVFFFFFNLNSLWFS